MASYGTLYIVGNNVSYMYMTVTEKHVPRCCVDIAARFVIRLHDT